MAQFKKAVRDGWGRGGSGERFIFQFVAGAQEAILR